MASVGRRRSNLLLSPETSPWPITAPKLIQIMRAALDDVMTRVPIDHATVAIKARMAELILKAAAPKLPFAPDTFDADLIAAGFRCG